MEEKDVRYQRNYKDTIFRMVFPEKEELLSLYNALNGTQYTNPEDIEITTLENAIYMNFKNDISFLIYDYLQLYEHQSTLNENMPLRSLIYICKQYEKLVDRVALHRSKLTKIPTPRFVVFYNGTGTREERLKAIRCLFAKRGKL